MSVKSLNKEETKEINDVLPIIDCQQIVYAHIKKHKNTYRISDRVCMTIIEELNSRLISNMLFKLSKEGFLETAFDDKQNDFVFWIKNQDETY